MWSLTAAQDWNLYPCVLCCAAHVQLCFERVTVAAALPSIQPVQTAMTPQRTPPVLQLGSWCCGQVSGAQLASIGLIW